VALKPKRSGATGGPASRLIDQRIRDLEGWRGETLARMRALIPEGFSLPAREWRAEALRYGSTMKAPVMVVG